jgi:hypothetical protein
MDEKGARFSLLTPFQGGGPALPCEPVRESEPHEILVGPHGHEHAHVAVGPLGGGHERTRRRKIHIFFFEEARNTSTSSSNSDNPDDNLRVE